MVYQYSDEYLEISEEQEQKAIKDITKLGIKDVFFIAKLVVLKAYIFNCLDNQTTKDDLYEIKLKHYKDEFKEVLDEARLQMAKNGDAKFNKFNAPLYRG